MCASSRQRRATSTARASGSISRRAFSRGCRWRPSEAPRSHAGATDRFGRGPVPHDGMRSACGLFAHEAGRCGGGTRRATGGADTAGPCLCNRRGLGIGQGGRGAGGRIHRCTDARAGRRSAAKPFRAARARAERHRGLFRRGGADAGGARRDPGSGHVGDLAQRVAKAALRDRDRDSLPDRGLARDPALQRLGWAGIAAGLPSSDADAAWPLAERGDMKPPRASAMIVVLGLGSAGPVCGGAVAQGSPATASAPVNPLAMQSLDGLSATREKPLFAPTRRPPGPPPPPPPPVAHAPPPPPPPAPPPALTFYGVVTEGDGARALVRGPANEGPLSVSPA